MGLRRLKSRRRGGQAEETEHTRGCAGSRSSAHACRIRRGGADGVQRTRRPGGNSADTTEETQCGGRSAGMNGASMRRGAADTADGMRCDGRCIRPQRCEAGVSLRRGGEELRRRRRAGQRTNGPTDGRTAGCTDMRASSSTCGRAGTRRDARCYDTRLSAGGVPPGSVRERLRRSMRSTITATAPSPVTLVAVPKLSMAM